MTNRAQDIENLKKEIENRLIEIQNFVSYKKKTNQEISFISELFLEELLNEIHKGDGFHFKNMNHQIPNYPAIDIADEEHGISYQVTVTNDYSDLKTKVNKTLEMFYSHGFHKKYNKLYIIITSGIPNRKKIPQKRMVRINDEKNPIKPELFTQKNIIDLIDLAKSEIFKRPSILQNILEVILKIPNRPKKKIYPFNIKHSYIERTVYNTINPQKKSLIESIKDIRLNVLLGVGGMGKTTETNFISNKVSCFGNYFCFVIRLIKYANSLEELINIYCPNWQNVPSDFKTFIILDGLDEINSFKFDTASNEIQLFAIKYPKINILVTCRTNFNPFSSSEAPDEDEKFNELYLNEINEEGIKKYIYKECKSPEIFFQSAHESKIKEIFKNPFYLVNAIEIFNFHNIIPKNRSDFYKKLIEQRIGEEKKKNPIFRNSLDEFALTKGLKILALTMQYSGEYKIEKIDFEQIIRSRETRENIKRIFFYEIDNYWQFEHNNFQEFLAAEAISDLNWDKIKKIILLPNGKLKPKWLNALSFLVNLVPANSELISWFVKNEIESLVKVEPEKIEEKIRNEIFKQIFERHKNEQTIIFRIPYSILDLVRFVKLETNEEVISFLLDELESDNKSLETISNIVNLLQEIINLPLHFKERVQSILLRLLHYPSNHKYGITGIIISSFITWKMFNKETIENVLQIENLFIDNGPLPDLCQYLVIGKYRGITSSLIIKFLNSFETQSISKDESQLYDTIQYLSEKELIKLIVELTPINNTKKRKRINNNLFKEINNQAIVLFNSNGHGEIINVVNDFIYLSYENYHHKEYASLFKQFFIETSLVFKHFKNRFKIDINRTSRNKNRRFSLPALIADIKCLDWVIKEYKKDYLRDDVIWSFLISLTFVKNNEGRKYFEEKINPLTNFQFAPKPDSWKVFTQKKDELYLKSLSNQKLAIKVIKKGLDIFTKDEITQAELSAKVFEEEEDKHSDVELAVGLDLMERFSNEDINKQTILNQIKNDWESFLLDEYSNLISYKTLPKENSIWLKEWCYNSLSKFSENEALEIYKDGSFLLQPNSYYFILFSMFLNLPFDENIFLKMTTTIGLIEIYFNDGNLQKEFYLYDYIMKNVPFVNFKNQLIRNVREKKLASKVLLEHIHIFRKENIVDSLTELLGFIKDPDLPKFIRLEILSFYSENNGSSEEILPVIDTLDLCKEDDYFDWNIVHFFVQKQEIKIVDFLRENIEYDNVDQIKIGIALAKLKQEIGFQVLIDNLQNKKNRLQTEEFTSFIHKLHPEFLNEEYLSDFFLKVLDKYLQENLSPRNYYDNVMSTLFQKWFELIETGNIETEFLVKAIEKTLNNCEKNESYRIAKYNVEELKQKANIYNDKGCQISDAIKELKVLGIDYEF